MPMGFLALCSTATCPAGLQRDIDRRDNIAQGWLEVLPAPDTLYSVNANIP